MPETNSADTRTDEQRLRLFRQSLGYAWAFRDYNDWPIKLNSVFHLFLEEFGTDFFEGIRCLEEEAGFTTREIARLFYNPARIYRLIDPLIFSMRRMKYSLQKQREVVLKLLSLVRALKHGSEFNEDGRNIIYEPAKVAEIAATLFNKKICDPQGSRFIHQFCGITWAYTESIFFRAHDVTKEIHGPYELENGEKLLVKEYLHLQPGAIWPKAQLLPCKTIKVFKKYNRHIKIRIDSLNHLYHDGGQPVPNLTGFYAEIDGKKASSEDLKKLAPQIQQNITEITGEVDRMSWHERVMKYAEIFWFRKKPLRDARGLNWELPREVEKKIRSGKPNPRRLNRLSAEQVYRLAMLSI